MSVRPSDRRGQSGLDRLVLFVLAVVVVLAVAPVVLGFVGVDVRGSDAGTDSGTPARLTVLGAAGSSTGENGTVDTVRIVVSNTGGGRVDPASLTATWVGEDTYSLVAAGAGSDADGTFTVEPLDPDRETAALDGHTDRAVLIFDLGSDDVAGATEFGSRLGPGETATVSLTASGGSTARADLAVPDPVPASDGFAL
jgi:archaellin